jgi:hypothetical protein
MILQRGPTNKPTPPLPSMKETDSKFMHSANDACLLLGIVSIRVYHVLHYAPNFEGVQHVTDIC